MGRACGMHVAPIRCRMLAVLFVALALGACDSGEVDQDPDTPDPDDIEVVLEAMPGTSRDLVKATVTSHSSHVLESIVVTLRFFDDENAQVGQMPIPFLGRFEQGDSAENELGLPASLPRHDSYACYRYRLDVTNEEGVTGTEEYGGTCE